MLLVCYPKCSTCKKAQVYLENLGVEYNYRDIKEENPSYDELKSKTDTLRSTKQNMAAAETDMRWFALTQDIDCGTDRTKILREVNVRFALGENAVVSMELRTDRGEVRKLASFTGAGIRRRTMHVRCKPCEDFRLYFSGFGECAIREAEIVYEIAKGEESHV